jgi:L-rhamnose-H+ transport protein
MADHFWLGMAVIFISGVLNGSFPLPMKYTRRWKWENTWLVFAATALLIIPWLLAAGFVPHLGDVYRGVSSRALLAPLIFGFLWGIAQVTFGLGISAVGMALAFAVVAGLSCLSGSLVPVLVLHPADLLRPRGILLLISMPILFAGLVLYGMAGRRREEEQRPAEGAAPSAAAMAFMTGLAICIFTGIFGSNINLGFAFSGPILEKAVALGAIPVTSTYASWALVLGAGFIPNLLYCFLLLSRNGTWPLFLKPGWARETGLGVAMGVLWVSGMVGYGIGATLVGKYGTSLGYVLFITAMILSSNFLGILTGEWRGTSPGTRRVLAAAVVVILISVLVLNLGGLY